MAAEKFQTVNTEEQALQEITAAKGHAEAQGRIPLMRNIQSN